MVGETAIENRSRTSLASADVEGSPTVGPEAIVEIWFPGTSDTARVNVEAGYDAAANRPPFIAERCLRTVFISLIVQMGA